MQCVVVMDSGFSGLLFDACTLLVTHKIFSCIYSISLVSVHKKSLTGASLPHFDRDGNDRDTCFFAPHHWIFPIMSPVFEIFKTPGMAIAIPAILVSPPLSTG